MNKQISKRVWEKAWRQAQEKGWSMEDFAQKLGMKNVQQLYNIKRGVAGIGNKVLGNMAAALDVSEESLLLEDRHIEGAADRGKYQYTLSRPIPVEILNLFDSDDTELQGMVLDFLRITVAERNLIARRRGFIAQVAPEGVKPGKWQGQGEPQTVEDALDKAAGE